MSDIEWQKFNVSNVEREDLLGQSGHLFWFTGLSGAGKSTLANAFEQELFKSGKKTYLLDGDNIRHGLCRDLGFSEADREENIRRISEVANLMVDAGLVVLASFISPTEKIRSIYRELIPAGKLTEVYVKCPIEVCKERDPKGLYQKIEAGKISNFTGVSSPFEEPLSPNLVIDTSKCSLEQGVTKLKKLIS